MTQPIVVNSSAMSGPLAGALVDDQAPCAKTPMPFKAVRRLYDDATLSVIRGLTGDGSLDQACAPIARQIIDETCWRSMRKGALQFCRSMGPGQQRQLARAFAYDRYLPTAVLPIARRMPGLGRDYYWVEVAYFADAIGVLGRPQHGVILASDKISAVDHSYFVARDVQHARDLAERGAAFASALSQWRAYLTSAHLDCDQLSMPEVECLLRDAQHHEPFALEYDRA